MSHSLGKIGLLVMLVSLLVSAYLMVAPQVPPRAAANGSRVADAIKQMPIDDEAEKRIDKLQPLLARLGSPASSTAAPIDLALLGYQKIVPPASAVVPESRLPVPKPTEYTVSMTYLSANRRFAVIDGRFYREGARLPGGERVTAISPRAVQIDDQGVTRSLEIRTDPVAPSVQGSTIKIDSADLGSAAQPPVKQRARPSTG